jgi:hypothetical protein
MYNQYRYEIFMFIEFVWRAKLILRQDTGFNVYYSMLPYIVVALVAMYACLYISFT